MKFLKKFDSFNEGNGSTKAAPSKEPSQPTVLPTTKPTTRPSRPTPIRRDKPAIEPAPKAEKKEPKKASMDDVIKKYAKLTGQKYEKF